MLVWVFTTETLEVGEEQGLSRSLVLAESDPVYDLPAIDSYCNLRIQLAVFLLSLLKHGPRLSKARVFSCRVSRRRHIPSLILLGK
jgi:hypothetical protein